MVNDQGLFKRMWPNTHYCTNWKKIHFGFHSDETHNQPSLPSSRFINLVPHTCPPPHPSQPFPFLPTHPPTYNFKHPSYLPTSPFCKSPLPSSLLCFFFPPPYVVYGRFQEHKAIIIFLLNKGVIFLLEVFLSLQHFIYF